ncbi:tyrosine-type recombinase/integrase [Flexistipes sinusarabici]|uniref:tyrosine-type recombinase/integrase n=1 Tax=Flexistipes sinusarabici TaxID=2352 RepID=UPI0023537833|nr:tyrosine-type recombinase/integrase [Flexistipes sinusarabici]
MKLTTTKIKGIKPKSKTYRVSDGNGLCLEVTPAGKKLWRFRYKKYDGKYTMLSIGRYPEVSLAEAREAVLEKRKAIAHGKPANTKKEAFEAVFKEWYEKNKNQWTENHAKTTYRRIEKNILPWLGNFQINDITPRSLLECLRRIENRGAVETAHRVLQICNQIFVYAVASGISEDNPAAKIKGALSPVSKNEFPAITELSEVKILWENINDYKGSFITQCGLKLLMLTFLRPGELRKGEWKEIDLRNRCWNIPAERMKKRKPHVVPLSKQALNILEELHPLTDRSEYIFPSTSTNQRPMSSNTLNMALRRMGYSKEELVAHGLRKTASTILHEQGWPSEIIEKQLAHIDRNQIRGIYNKAKYLQERKIMLQHWADYLDELLSADEAFIKKAPRDIFQKLY